MKKILLLFILFFGANFNLLLAQTSFKERYILKQYTTENGLPQNSVKSIAPDADGFIWLATEDGLVRFDGQRFFIFNQSNVSITSNRFYLMQPSPDGRIKSARNPNRVMYASTDRNEFVRIENGIAVRDSAYVLKIINPMLSVNNGYGSTAMTIGLPTYLNEASYPSLYCIPTGYGEGDFYSFSHNKIEHYHQWKRTADIPIRSKDFWNFFTMGSQLYVLNETGSISVVAPSGLVSKKIDGDILKDPAYGQFEKKVNLYWNHAGDEVFFNLGKNLYLLNKPVGGTMTTTLVLSDFDLKTKNVQSVYYDKISETMFLGSLTGGLFVIRKSSFHTLTTAGDDMENVFYAQTVYQKDKVLTPKGILFSKNKVSGEQSSKLLPAMMEAANGDGGSVIIDKSGHIWAKDPTHINQFDSEGKKMLRQISLGKDMRAMYKDEKEILWISHSDGLYRLDLSNPISEPELFIKTNNNFKHISFLESVTADQLMIGTEHGLFTVDIATQKLTIIKGTESLFIRSIYCSKPSEIWITTLNGLFVLLNNKLIKLPLDKRNFLARSHCVVEDKKGYLWIPTNQGLFQIQKKDLLNYASRSGQDLTEQVSDNLVPFKPAEIFYQYYSKDNGFATNEFNGGCVPCAVRLPNGYVSLPSLRGLVWFLPEQIKVPVINGNILLDKVEYDQNSFLSQIDEIQLPSASKNIKLYFSTSYFGHPDNLNLSYALIENGAEPQATDWLILDSQDFKIVFSSLQAGNYTLFVRKLNGFGANSFVIKSIQISVLPQWFETLWMRIIFSLMLIFTGYLFVKRRFNKFDRENKILEHKIETRTRSLNNALTELEASKNEISRQFYLLSRMVASITHDIQSPLNHIATTSEKVPDLLANGQYDLAGTVAARIADSSQSLSHLLKDSLDYIKVHLYGKDMSFKEVNLKELVDDKLYVFKSINNQNANRIVNDIPSTLSVVTDHQLLGIIVHNIIDNAAKYTRNGVINVTAGRVGDQVEMVISNNGIPIANELLDLFNETTLTKNDTSSSTPGRRQGLGLLIIKEIASLIQIQIILTQTKTTNFRIIF